MTSDDVIAAQQRVYGDPAHDPTTPVLWDARGGETIRMTTDEMAAIVERSRSFWSGMKTGRTAILVGSEANFGMGRMYQQLAADMPRRLGVFAAYEEAAVWLDTASPDEAPGEVEESRG